MSTCSGQRGYAARVQTAGDLPGTPAPTPSPGMSLPLLDQAPPTERADAARNRARILAAAQQVFAKADPSTVTMRDIADAAGVGRATLYRRFPDPRSVAVALLDEHERELQHELLRGAPPLGPGAEPAERLAAFYTAMIELLDQHLHLALGAEHGATRFASGAYRFWRIHVRTLLDEADVPDSDGLADVLLAGLAPEVYQFQRDTIGLSRNEVLEPLHWMARQLLRLRDDGHGHSNTH
jgi:AcrR family transcriptional regulator